MTFREPTLPSSPTVSALLLAIALLLSGSAVATVSRASTTTASVGAAETFSYHQAGGAIRAPRRAPAGPNRLGDRECCKAPDCRCGCLYSLVGAAVAALRSR